eukprot:TRINITY_DN78803_c0_g1_i1.p1 TRINITY_DN78803_c0_g1~~TRINITY_DN78803_c0_g1_i1.p1  ORF type:complete len:208 (+),score=14.37 TRINITY_DN78803_c0_g1_i1:87-626(+)
MSLSEGLEQLEWVQALWAESHDPKLNLRDFMEGHAVDGNMVILGNHMHDDVKKTLRDTVCVTDCKSFFDVFNKNSVPQDKRTAIELTTIKQCLRRRNHSLRWVDTRYMLADSPTKAKHDSNFLRETLTQGTCGIHEEAQGLRLRAEAGKNRTGRKHEEALMLMLNNLKKKKKTLAKTRK